MSDFKELVPEFYDTGAEGDFLDNLHGIEFGYRHDGTRVSNVALPPWAAGWYLLIHYFILPEIVGFKILFTKYKFYLLKI